MKAVLAGPAAAAVLLFSSLPAAAQYGLGGDSSNLGFGRPGAVSGSGKVTIERKPETMRMEVDLLSKAGTLKEALSGLKDRIAAARAQVVVLGAEKDSIDVGSPRLSSLSNDQQQQMEMMLAKRLRSGGNEKNQTSTPVTVTAKLTAAWKLEGTTVEELLLQTHSLKEKIKEADVAGTQEANKLSPEQQEIFEELQGSGLGSFGGLGATGEQQPGQPVFYFVSPIPEAELDKALAEGFQKAKAKAARLAKAAGSQLGELKSLASYNADQYDAYNEYDYLSYDSPLYQALQVARSRQQQKQDEVEAVGVEPGKVNYRLIVTASFDLK